MPTEKPRILVVDDDGRLRDVLVRYLLFTGFDVAAAADGAEALGLVGSFAPDLVILDIMMPGLDGTEVCRRIKSTPETSDILVVVLSALRDEQTAAAEAGADGFIPKPFNLHLIEGRVRAFLSGTSPAGGVFPEADAKGWPHPQA